MVPGTCNPVQLKLFGSIVTSMWEEVEKDKSKCWDIAAALAGLKLVRFSRDREGGGKDVSVAVYWEESSLPVAVRRQLRGNIYLFGGSSS